jgi:hypothetical protein
VLEQYLGNSLRYCIWERILEGWIRGVRFIYFLLAKMLPTYMMTNAMKLGAKTYLRLCPASAIAPSID